MGERKGMQLIIYSEVKMNLKKLRCLTPDLITDGKREQKPGGLFVVLVVVNEEAMGRTTNRQQTDKRARCEGRQAGQPPQSSPHNLFSLEPPLRTRLS